MTLDNFEHQYSYQSVPLDMTFMINSAMFLGYTEAGVKLIVNILSKKGYDVAYSDRWEYPDPESDNETGWIFNNGQGKIDWNAAKKVVENFMED